MGRKSEIEQLPEDIREEIFRLLRANRTIDQIREKLAELLEPGELPSRSSIGRYVLKASVLADRMKQADDLADRMIERLGDGQEEKLTRLNARLINTAVFDLLSAADEQGEVSIDAKNAKLISETLRNLALAKKTDAELTIRIRDQVKREIEAEMRRKLEEASTGEGGFDPAAAEEARRILGFA